MNLSKYFTLAELTVSNAGSRAGLDNHCPEGILPALKRTAEKMDKVRNLLGQPIHVLSGYRSSAVNDLVRGSHTSAHMKGEAVDFISPRFGTPMEICQRLAGSDVVFDQIIYEYGSWVHIGFSASNRKQLLTKRYGFPYERGLIAQAKGD